MSDMRSLSGTPVNGKPAGDLPEKERLGRDLLEAGAVLPLGGAGGDVLTARAYGHPALDERAVVRLVPGAIGAAEDLALEYLGFGAAEVSEVGQVKRQSLGFPAWALVNDPGNGHHALAVVKEMERLTRLVGTKPGLAKEGFDEIGERLDRSVPHFLPTYYEQVARLFLAVESRQQASVFFGKARAAEQRHALEVDEERLREVFLEFAGAGALTGKALREHAKALTVRLSAAEAYGQFRAVSLERCAAGLAPYAGMLEDLRRLAKGAGLDADAEERSLLAEIIHTGPMNRAAGSFWKAALPSLAAIAAEDRSVRERLLTLLPATGGDRPEEFDASWLALLDRCGAVELLVDGTVPAAEWLSSWAGHRQRGWRTTVRLEAELTLVERLVERLVADGTPVRLLSGYGRRVTADLDLLDACLAWGVPVADPSEGTSNLHLADWLTDDREGRRDLVALTSDPRFTHLLRTGVEQVADSGDSTERLGRIVDHPALRTVLVGWLTDRADDLSRPFGLPGLNSLLRRLSRFSSPSVLATAPEAVRRITAVSPAPALARTLRAGILDELGWPALDEALPGLGTVDPEASGQRYGYRADRWYQMRDSWPALLVRVDTQVAAVGPMAVLDQRPLTPPAASSRSWDAMTIRYAGGQWLIANGYGDERRAVWSGRPAEVFKPKGDLNDHWTDAQTPSLELPDGGRCYGGRPVYAGDTSFAAERRPVASDGISVWVLHENQWWEYDPESARRGRVSVPAFFDSAPAGGGVQLLERACRLLPVQPGLESSPFGTKDGLLGWWVTYDPKDGTLTACSVDGGRSPAVPVPAGARVEHLSDGIPVPPLRLPGGASLYPRETRGYSASVSLYDADGIQLARFEDGGRGGAYAAGTPLVAPLSYWHALRTRDEQGSAALRAVTEADARALLASVAEGTKAEAAVRRLLPDVTHPGLVAGVAGLVDEAARHSGRIATLAERAARGPASENVEKKVRHAHDTVLSKAFHGFAVPTYRYFYHHVPKESATVLEQIRLLPKALARDAVPGHTPIEWTGQGWVTLAGAGMAALTLRAASPATSDEHRAALLEFLDAALTVEADGDALLIDPRGRLRAVELRIPGSDESKLAGEVRHAGARRLVILGRLRSDEKDAYWHCVEYDPAGAFGGWDGCVLIESEVLGAADDPVRAPVVRRVMELVRERGPLPYRPEQALDFAERVGIAATAGGLLQLGSPEMGSYRGQGVLPAAYLKSLGAKNAEVGAGVATLGALSVGERRTFSALLLPTGPERVAELWTTGFALEPLTEAWIAARGRRRPVPPALIRQLVAEMGGGTSVQDTLNPEWREELTGRTEQRMADGELEPAEPRLLLTGSTLCATVDALRWLAYRLPYGDPLREVLPVTARMLRERLADPGLLLHLGVDRDAAYDAVSGRLREARGLAPERGAGDKEIFELSSALVLTPSRYGSRWETVWVRPSAVLPAEGADGPDRGEGGPDHPDLTLLAATAGAAPRLTALRTLLSAEFMELVTADGPPGPPQDPRLGAPALVGEVAERFGLSEDAAVLYLMLLALPDPTDRHQAEWTGWKPARLKKARAELAATDLVVEAKRARAGRSLFLPGGWLEQQTPRLPAESWKTALLPWALPLYVVPDRPVPELYEAAWRRVVEGDAPGFEEFQGRSGRGGRR
ncbi:hypothetical protein OIE62_14435 [Streptomyces scopuliridis]|uniref:Uncharacterized protein n=1 Tax=Streptomyces scopuliridis TaxID=452529 RepID=A0ACD4ZPG6_9ACTN|nr:hypothetical protein [Streptomyces scopuliridis]WSC00284.1 hypothetical protein OG835_26960 [Streptomyces scopuliridis]WSC06105.1 hypothetical protein OIE62_14435 [Streptomyces scopuliridis]